MNYCLHQLTLLVWVLTSKRSTGMELLALKISSDWSPRVQVLMTMTSLGVKMPFEMLEVLLSQKSQTSLLQFPRQIDDSGYQHLIWIRSP